MSNTERVITAALGLLLILPLSALAQERDTLIGDPLPEVEIMAARGTETSTSAPFSVSLRWRDPAEVALEPGLSLDDTLGDLPGLWINDRGHFALGERISVRGLGWRSAFGVRGLQIVLDGIPLTLPDGQTFEEIIEPSLIRRAELIRGPASQFWGNGSGGVLFLSTQRPEHETTARARVLAGSYGERQLLAHGGAQAGRHYVQGYVSDIRQDGYREYSQGRRTRTGLHGTFDLGTHTDLRALFAFVNQDTENPSSLTREQLQENPRQARPDFVQAQAGKQSTQAQTGLTLDHRTDVGLVSAAAYGLVRSLDNPLPFGYVAYDRQSGGARLTLQQQREALEWGVGLDAGVQQDDRKNWNIVNGEPGEDLELDQLETVLDLAGSGYARLDLIDHLRLSLGLRVNRINFANNDRLIQSDDPAIAGDQSGSRTLSAWSPSAGLSYRLGSALLFASYSTAFETPTTTELVNRPDGSGGFNPDLEPQRSRGVEVGARGTLDRADLQYDVALFHMMVEDALIQIGTNDLGREFFGNAGRNLHQGVEAALTWQPIQAAELELSYTGSRLQFRGDEREGNDIPGVPDHRFYANMTGNHSGFRSRLSVEAVSSYYVDDANTAENPGYVVLDWRLGHRGFHVDPATVQPFIAVNNLLDEQYNASVSVNAFGGRFYEPAPGRTLQVGLNVAF